MALLVSLVVWRVCFTASVNALRLHVSRALVCLGVLPQTLLCMTAEP